MIRAISPFAAIFYFTPIWLGLLGAVTVWGASGWDHARIIGLVETAAGLLWLSRPTRAIGMGLMVLVLVAALVLHIRLGQFPGQIVFYGAVLAFLILESRRLARSTPA